VIWIARRERRQVSGLLGKEVIREPLILAGR